MFSDSARDALTEQGVADVLTFQLKRAPDAERRHVILEILGSLGENGKTCRIFHQGVWEREDLLMKLWFHQHDLLFQLRSLI